MGVTTFAITTFSIMTLSIIGLYTTQSLNDILLDDTQQTSIEFYYAECRDYLNAMVSVAMLNVIMLIVVMLSVVALSIKA